MLINIICKLSKKRLHKIFKPKNKKENILIKKIS